LAEYIDGKIVKSNTPAEVGKYFQNTPKNSFSIRSTYSLRKLSVGGGPRFMELPWQHQKHSSGWELLDLNNAYYFDRLGGGHLIPGAAHSVMLSTGFHF
jgi:catecholate siderophore receptor